MYKPVYRITPYLLNLVDQASALKALLEAGLLKVSWLPVVQKDARVRATHSSTAIEGNPLTLSQVRSVEEGEGIRLPMADRKEIVNYLKALRFIEKQGSAVISEKAILKLHKLLMDALLPKNKCGKYKDKQHFIIDEKGIKIYTPPSPKQTPKLVRELIDWLNSKEARELHSILVCAIVHHRLVSIHPFSDGNGRLARILGTWVLYQKGFDPYHIFTLDDYFAGNRERYYQKIQQARELDDDLTHWIEYVAGGAVQTLKDVKKRVEGLQVSSKTEISLSPRQEELLRLLRDKASLSVADLRTELGLTRARINQIISPLIKEGLIVKKGQSKATRYLLALRKT